jgi:hypothetical protein
MYMAWIRYGVDHMHGSCNLDHKVTAHPRSKTLLFLM